MRHRAFKAVGMLLLLLAAPGAAQDWGPPRFGLQAGFTQVRYAGLHTRFYNAFDLPGLNFGPDEPWPAVLYVIAPIAPRLALEPSLTVSSNEEGVFWETTMQAGLRADYLLTRHVYAAGGIVLGRLGRAATPLRPGFTVGMQAAAGYRLPVASSLELRTEVLAQFWRAKTKAIPAYDTYSILVGVAAPLASRASPAGTAARSAPPATTWRLSLGTSAGVVDVHFQDRNAEQLAVMFPSWGSGGGPAVSSPSLYLTIPVTRQLALEPGLDVHRYHAPGYDALFSHLSTRLNYGFRGGWYAGAGLDLGVRKLHTGGPLLGLTGGTVDGGYRFHLTGAWEGRLEVSHTIMAQQRAARSPPLTATALVLGATVALD